MSLQGKTYILAHQGITCSVGIVLVTRNEYYCYKTLFQDFAGLQGITLWLGHQGRARSVGLGRSQGLQPNRQFHPKLWQEQYFHVVFLIQFPVRENNSVLIK